VFDHQRGRRGAAHSGATGAAATRARLTGTPAATKTGYTSTENATSARAATLTLASEVTLLFVQSPGSGKLGFPFYRKSNSRAKYDDGQGKHSVFDLHISPHVFDNGRFSLLKLAKRLFLSRKNSPTAREVQPWFLRNTQRQKASTKKTGMSGSSQNNRQTSILGDSTAPSMAIIRDVAGMAILLSSVKLR
jgi:hypothetical protein